MVKAISACLENEIEWFNAILMTRIALYFNHECNHKSIYDHQPPVLQHSTSFYAEYIQSNDITFEERLIIVLALLPHVCPQMLDTFFIHNKNFDRPFTEFGGWKGSTHGGFLPTGETALFLIAGNSMEQRIHYCAIFGKEHHFFTHNLLKLVGRGENEPFLSGALILSDEYLSRFIHGKSAEIEYSSHFPAKKITTELNWNDVVLNQDVIAEIEHIISWIKYEHIIRIDWNLGKFIKPGFRTMFYGPPGTGKTLTACLIGKSIEVNVYRIDLSMIVSKYIGETEKNLATVFDMAENKNWILFFDEADALFGKRTQTSSSNDRYANQEISYLLQRIEDYSGVVILATNLRANIDEAFARRFQSMVYFPFPSEEQRLLLWKRMLQNQKPITDTIDCEFLARTYELTGGAIVNVIRFAAVQALQKQHQCIEMDDIVIGITKELLKEGKSV